MTVRQKILIPRFLFLLSLNILKNGQCYCACAARWGKTPDGLDALERTALFATSFPGFFFVKYVVTVDDAVDRTPKAIHVAPLIIDCSNESEYVGGWKDILMQQRNLENATD